MEVKITLPLLPLRDIVVFPNMVIPLFVGRDKSISALNEVMKHDKKIVLVTLALLEHMPGQIQKIKLFMFSYQIEHIQQ